MSRCFQSNLTPGGVCDHNSEELGDLVPAITHGEALVESQLPEGWVPDGTAVWVALRYDPEIEQWESLIPAFSIAGMGRHDEDAAVNALELLDDYLLACHNEGKTLDESWRPSSAGLRLRFVVQAMREIISAQLLHVENRRSNYLRLPLRGRVAH
jgi:hypothetical protein